MTVKVRFAPSPTGRLHVGNIRTALVNWLYTKGQNGAFVLRIDDTDVDRSTPENEAAIETDLKWLGLEWDERHNQSARFDRYHEVAEKLKAEGRLYPAYETQEELDRRRKVQLSRGQPPIYDRAALDLTEQERAAFEAEGRRPHWRFKLEGKRVAWEDMVRGHSEVDTASLSDPVFIREDGQFLYTLPSVIDDIDMGITHVVRGEDHVTNTGTQIEVFEALGAALPNFVHMSLLVDAEGQALSKRIGSLSIGDMRELGYEPSAITSHLGRIGTSDPIEYIAAIDQLVRDFTFDKLGRSPARYDLDDLDRLNGDALRLMDYETAKPRLEVIGADLGPDFWVAVRENLERFNEAKRWAEILTGPPPEHPEIDPTYLAAARQAFVDTVSGEPSLEDWKVWTDTVKANTGAKGGALYRPLRQALTGLNSGPDMAQLLRLLGRERILERLG